MAAVPMSADSTSAGFMSTGRTTKQAQTRGRREIGSSDVRFTFRQLLLAAALLAGGSERTHAAPLTGIAYTYDLSGADVDPGGFEAFIRPHASAKSDIVNDVDQRRIVTAGLLTDGNFGSLEKVPFGFPAMVLFANGTYAGFRGDPGIGHAPKPKIDVDLGGTFALRSFTLHYLVEDATSIYSPRPVPDQPGDPMFDALTVAGSTDGVNFSVLGFSNDFRPLFGVDGDFGSGVEEIRTATIDLGGASASHLSIDVRTPWTYIFLSEVVVDGVASGPTPDFDADGDVDGSDWLIWQRGFGVSSGATAAQGDADANQTVDAADLAAWTSRFGVSGSNASIMATPEPSSGLCAALTLGAAVVARPAVRARRKANTTCNSLLRDNPHAQAARSEWVGTFRTRR